MWAIRWRSNAKGRNTPLYWLDVNGNFFDLNRFVGDLNIGHMVEQTRQ